MKRATQCVATYMVCQLMYPTKVDLFFVRSNPFCNLCAYVHNDYICEEGSSTFLCVFTLHTLPVSLVRGRDTRQSLFLCRSASAQINRPVKTCRVVGPPRLSTGRRWHCFLVHPDNQGLEHWQLADSGRNV